MSEPNSQAPSPNRPDRVPPRDEETAGLTPDELAEAKRYGRQELVCTLIDRAIDLGYLAVVALLFAREIDALLREYAPLAEFASLRLVVLLLLVLAGHAVVSFPLSFYSGYVLEHRFGLSRLTPARWLWRHAKRLALAVALATVVCLGLYWIIWTAGPAWWVVGAAASFVMTVVLGQLVPVLILPLFYKVERFDDAELGGRLSALAEGTGLAIEGVYRMALSVETVKANAMLAGLGRTRRVILGDTLLDRFAPEEIEVVFAHEVGHHVFRHMPKMILAAIFYSAAGFWVCDRLLAAWVEHVEGRFSYADLPVYTLPWLMLILAAFGLVTEPLQNAVSRRFERQADQYALERTGNRAAYISAFQKLARLNKDDPDPHWLEVLLFRSHPPIAQRVAEAAAEGEACQSDPRVA